MQLSYEDACRAVGKLYLDLEAAARAVAELNERLRQAERERDLALAELAKKKV